MPLSAYVQRVALQAGLTLACAVPFVLLGGWSVRTRRWGQLAFIAALVVLDVALVEIPRFGIFRRLHWGWQEGLLATTWPFLFVAVVPGISLNTIGVASWFRAGWLRPCVVALLIAIAVPAVFFLLGLRKRLDVEGWAFLLLVPGLAEALVFRGVFQSLLNRVFGRPWRVAGACAARPLFKYGGTSSKKGASRSGSRKYAAAASVRRPALTFNISGSSAARSR